MKIRPLHDYVIVRRNEEEHLSKGGIVIPDAAAEKPQQGEVVAVGKGRILEEGRLLSPSVKPGDQILFDRYTGTEIIFQSERLLVMHESDIMAVIEL